MTRHQLFRAGAPLAWAAMGLALARVPAVVRHLPALGVLDGPLGLVLALTAVLVAGAAVLPGGKGSALVERVAALRGPVLFFVAFGVLAGLGLHYTAALRVSGDEPHYLLMAQSLWREGDLDLRDNFEREDYREYTPGPVAPHYGAPRADGRPFPAHSPGLALLLAPVYAMGGRPGCVLLLAALGAWLAREMGEWARRTGATPEASLLAWALALVPPAAFYSFHVYTELPSAVAAAVALRWVDSRPGVVRAAGAALLAGALPWLHVKMIPAAIVVGILGLVRLRGRVLAAFLAAAAAMAAALLFHYWRVFGVPSPLALYGGLPRGETGAPLRAAAGLLLDRSFGLLPHAPVYLLALPGLAVLARKRAWPLLGLAAAVVGPVLAWRMWWGGQCPPARFVVPALVVLAAAVAATASSGRGLARWRWPLLGLSLAMAIGMAARPGALLLLNRGDRPTRVWTALSGSRDVSRYLPSLTLADAEEARVAVVWLAALAVLITLHALAMRREDANRLFGGLGLPLVLLLGIGLAVDRWARPTADPPASSRGAGASAAGPRADPPPRPG